MRDFFVRRILAVYNKGDNDLVYTAQTRRCALNQLRTRQDGGLQIVPIPHFGSSEKICQTSIGKSTYEYGKSIYLNFFRIQKRPDGLGTNKRCFCCKKRHSVRMTSCSKALVTTTFKCSTDSIRLKSMEMPQMTPGWRSQVRMIRTTWKHRN